MDPAPLLLTRPLARSQAFAAQALERLGPRPVIVSPILEITPQGPPPDLSACDALVLSSASGLIQAPTHGWPQGMPAYCVGRKTARAAEQVGLHAISADGAAEDLIALLRRKAGGQRLCHLRGAHQAGDIAQNLAQAGVSIRSQIVYDQTAQKLSKTALDALAQSQPLLIPVFSPRSAALLHPELKKARAKLCLAAISPAVAKALSVQSGAQIHVASRPDADAVLDCLATFQNGLRS
ncbi:MAG: uroporphyrinogen-III synthase [Mangrovicoccus sp.]